MAILWNAADFEDLAELSVKELEVLARELSAALKRVQDELEIRYDSMPTKDEP